MLIETELIQKAAKRLQSRPNNDYLNIFQLTIIYNIIQGKRESSKKDLALMV